LPEGAHQQVFITLANALGERGELVDLVAPRVDSAVDSLASGVRVVNLDARATRVPWVSSRRKRWVPASTPEIAAYLRRERPKTLFGGGLYNNLAALWARQYSGASTRIVIVEGNPLSKTIRNSGRIKLFAPLLVRRFYSRADAWVGTSLDVSHNLAELAGVPREQVASIGNPVLTPEVLQRMDEPLEHPWLTPGSPPVILGVGRLAVQKDFATLVRAFGKLRAKRPARLLILGEGRCRVELEALVDRLGLGEDVALPGFVANPLPYMKRASVFALSSIYEGFGNVIVEALAAGCPIVSTCCPGGPAEILEKGNYGAMVAPGNPDAFGGALVQALDAPLDRERLQARARDYSPANIARLYEALV
jgi:glycosyltransferase involved in cell wall biosynthesis